MEHYLVALQGDWALHRDFAVRSAGFPVSGLEVFGSPDEPERLRQVAADAAFREALTWQNRGALRGAVDALANPGGQPSRVRQREELVARYWQRYCSKNDTIGFFGPLAWGTISDDGEALSHDSRALVRERTVHLEVWVLERFLQTVTDDPWLPLTPWPEEDARERLARIEDEAARRAAIASLDRLVAARDRVADATRDELADALDDFDSVYEEIIGEPPAPAPMLAAGGRTPIYMDAMRDLDVKLGPAFTAELAASLVPLFESSRWACGRTFEVGTALVREVVGDGGPRPLAPLLGEVLGALGRLPEILAAEHDSVQTRWAELLSDPDRSTLAERARARFADFKPAWPLSVFHGPDVQIAAASADAVARGDYLAVVGDFHPGTAPLGQGVFTLRHPDPSAFKAMWTRELGTPIVFVVPPRGLAHRMTARLFPAMPAPTDVHVLPSPHVRVAEGTRSVALTDLIVDGSTVTDRDNSFRAPLETLFWAQMFTATVLTFDPFPEAEHTERVVIGRTVLKRESWRVALGDCPTEPVAVCAWAREHGMPRRVFVKFADEPKPTFLDVESPVLTRVFARQIRGRLPDQAAATLSVSEMLPGPEDCWLELDGERYTSELRITAVDLTRRGQGSRLLQ
jgi:hypothetical protein